MTASTAGILDRPYSYADDFLHKYFSKFLKHVYTTVKGNILQLECGPMPNLMVALPNIGGALCSTPQSMADAHY